MIDDAGGTVCSTGLYLSRVGADLRSILLESCYYMLLAMILVCRKGYVAHLCVEGVEEEVL